MADPSKRRSVRQAVSRKRSVYVDPDTDDDFEANLDVEPPAEGPRPSSSKRRKTKPRPKPTTRSRAKRRRPLVLGQPRKANTKEIPVTKKEFSGPSDYRVPPWTSLPLNILRDIFVFASQPLHEETAESRSNTAWLLKAARIHRAFALPALEAFYQAPGIHAPLDLHHFLDLLQKPAPERYINYNVKVKGLYIDVRRLAYLAPNKAPFDLNSLVDQLPQLQHMEILHPMYLPPYRPLAIIQKWTFSPNDLFHAMNRRNIKLKSWRWSRNTIPRSTPQETYMMMTHVHETTLFEYLERLVVCGFNFEDSAEPNVVHDPETNGFENNGSRPPGLASAIAKLPALKDLSFISCDIIMENFLQRLPPFLQRLELANCLEITSDMLRKFFSTSGANLRELVLNHNPALSLSFLPGLKNLCTRLEVLRMDLHYFSERFNVNDAAALYDELLNSDETPSWPSTLRHLELVHAQKWSAEAAQNLFRSLVDSADELPALRILILHAHMNIPWRDRVGFRDQWIERLQRVYQRRSKEPLHYLGSFRQFRLWKQMTQAEGLPSASKSGSGDVVTSKDGQERLVRREFSHIQVSPRPPTGDTDIYTDSDVPEASTIQRLRRSNRVAESSQLSQVSESATPITESESEDNDEDDWRGQPEKFIQGLCDIVDVRIDNQRPRENQFTEGDFLDSEISGDGDWEEGADEDGENDGYAW